MSAVRIDGKAIAGEIGEEIKTSVSELVDRTGVVPTLAVVRTGEDPGSVWYAKAISRTMATHGMVVQLHVLDAEASQGEITERVSRLGEDPVVHGILIQEPLPKNVDEGAVRAALSPTKDVDGVHEINAGRLALAAPAGRQPGVGAFFVPATPLGAMELLRHCGVKITGKSVVVLGRSAIVGKPLALLLLRENATVTICHSQTADLRTTCRQADILCVAVGQAEMVRGDWIKPGAVVIDFGTNEVERRMVGDVNYNEAIQVAGMVTPVPGGTGPMTSVMMCANVLSAAKRQLGMGDHTSTPDGS
jgi:methylenetetrahydrofolate dehydrogenase (NADP+)/methenyltetrahydrofolate cyclohydrolase